MRKTLHSVCFAVLVLTMGQTVQAKTVKAKPDVIATVKTVQIVDDIKMPEYMAYFMGARYITGKSADPVIQEPRDQIVATMKANQVELPAIIKAEFAKALQNAGHITSAEGSENADARIDIEVITYGLGQRQGLSSVFYPLLTMEAKMTRSDGTVIWQKSDYLTPQNKENIGHTFVEYTQQPEYLRQTWTNIAGILSRLLVKTIYPPVKK